MRGSALAPESPEIVRQVRGESDPGTTFHRVGLELKRRFPEITRSFTILESREGPYQGHWGLLLIERDYWRFHIQATIKTLC